MYCNKCEYYSRGRVGNDSLCTKAGRMKPVSALGRYDCFKPKTKHTMEEEKAKEQTKVCKRCGRDLPASEFYTHKNRKDGLQPYCRKCQSDMVREARERKKDDAPKEDPGKPIVWDDAALVAELRRRGYEVKCTKTVTVEL